MPCIPVTPAPWGSSAPTILLGDIAALDNTSKLICAWGGVIQVVYPGQVTEQITWTERIAVLLIRAEQMKTFEQAAMLRFENEMVEYSKDISPRVCEVIGDERLRLALRSAITRAIAYGFTNRGSIRLFIEMMFFCGSAFDTDPQYLRVGEVLLTSVDQMQRAEQIHEGYLDYLDKVSGPGAVDVHKDLRDLEYFPVHRSVLPQRILYPVCSKIWKLSFQKNRLMLVMRI